MISKIFADLSLNVEKTVKFVFPDRVEFDFSQDVPVNGYSLFYEDGSPSKEYESQNWPYLMISRPLTLILTSKRILSPGQSRHQPSLDLLNDGHSFLEMFNRYRNDLTKATTGLKEVRYSGDNGIESLPIDDDRELLTMEMSFFVLVQGASRNEGIGDFQREVLNVT